MVLVKAEDSVEEALLQALLLLEEEFPLKAHTAHPALHPLEEDNLESILKIHSTPQLVEVNLPSMHNLPSITPLVLLQEEEEELLQISTQAILTLQEHLEATHHLAQALLMLLEEAVAVATWTVSLVPSTNN